MTASPTDRSAMAVAVNSLVGLAIWGARVGVGSFLTLDMGGTRYTSTGNVQGDFRLWVDGAAWRILEANAVLALFSDEQQAMNAAAGSLMGRRIAKVRFSPGEVKIALEFDGSLSLEVEPTGEPDVEHWSLFLPDARVVVAGPGKTLHIARADEPDLWEP